MTAADWKRRISILIAFVVLGMFASDVLAQPTRPARRGSKYKVRIDSAPQQAAVYLDDEQYGVVGYTPWEGRLQRGDWKVIIKKDGYETATRTVTVSRTRKLQETFIPLVKKEDPAKVDVRADADKNAFGAQVWLDGQLQGQIPVILNADDGRHLVEVKKEGFHTFSQWVQTKEGTTVTVNPALKAIEVAKKGSILIEADVPDAEVYIDGNRHADLTPTLINDIIEGPHVIEVRKEPAMPWKQTVNVTDGKTVKVSAQLKATMGGQGGSIRVLSNVDGARVFLDGTDLGPVPMDIKDVKAGEHVVEVKAPGYLPREERLTVSAGSAAVLKLDLQPIASKEVAKLKIVSPVPEAAVFVDGERVGTAPQDKEVPAGEHFVVVTKTGYKKFEQKIRVEAGQSLTVTAELAAVGSLRVLSTPAGAEVLMDGEPIGATPLNKEDVDVGEHVVTVRLPEHYEFEKQITIQGGQRTIVTSKLEMIDTGPTPEELAREQRGLSSFGARTLPLGRSTVDIAGGYPYFADGQITVGAGKIGGFGFDAGVFFRSFVARTELGAKLRLTLADKEPFSFALFTAIGGGSNFLDDSGRNTFILNAGALGSLTAFGNLTVTGRAYVDYWSDRHCPPPEETGTDPVPVCPTEGALTPEQEMRLTELGIDRDALIERETGTRLMLSAIAEIAVSQRWNLWLLFEGAPFQEERAAYTDLFHNTLLKEDIGTYVRFGGTFKF